MEGLLLSEMPETVKGMLQNFLDLVQPYGGVGTPARVGGAGAVGLGRVCLGSGSQVGRSAGLLLAGTDTSPTGPACTTCSGASPRS